MEIPKDAWVNNPMLQDQDNDSPGPEDGAINHDHYVYGTPKRFVKNDGMWVEAAQRKLDQLPSCLPRPNAVKEL